MKTIEERAREYAPDPVDPDCILPAREEYIVNQQRNAYIAGAIDQKVIDDAEYVNKALMGKGSSINCYKQGFHDAVEMAKTAFGKTCGWLSTYPSCESWYNELFENFIKNMEE